MFTLSFWKNAAEATIVAAATAFVGVFGTQGALTLHGLEAAGIAAVSGAIYALVKQLGAVQSAKGTPKVDTPATKVAK